MGARDALRDGLAPRALLRANGGCDEPILRANGGRCDDFLWGTATSAHQVEGGNVHSDWWAFEQRFTPSGRACDFVRLFEEDLDRARALGTNAFRFSLEWARIEPHPGQRDPAAVAYYDRLLRACRARGLRPMVTLHHFTLPNWCAARGGWLSEETLPAFARHVRFVARRYGDLADLFVTVNEPNVQAGAGYLSGVFAPGRRLRPDLAERCLGGLGQAHAIAYRILHEEIGGNVAVGAAPHLVAWRRSRWDPFGLVRREGQRFNWSFIERPEVRDALDFVGVNYYMGLRADPISALRFAGFLRHRRGPGRSDLGWPIDPRGFEEVLVEAHRRSGRPVIVTENGIADAGDLQRGAYLEAHVAALDRAIRAGADVRGYFHWSLIDNFEWHEGFAPRFGLHAVDYATQARTPRPSCDVYRRLIEARRAPVEAGVP